MGQLVFLVRASTPSAATVAAETDEELLRRLCAGDHDALARIYVRYAGPFRRVARRLLHNREDADDLLHDVFCEALRNADHFDPARASVKTWLLVLLRSRAIDRIRSRSSQQRAEAHAQAERPTIARDDAATRYLGMRVRECVQGLPDKQRRLIELAYFDNLAMAEIAEELRWPIGTVKSKLHRYLKTLATARTSKRR